MAKKILVIDDDQLLAKTLAKCLKGCGYNVDVVSGGEEALKKTQHGSFDLIISDVRMPVMNGIEAISKMRERNQKEKRRNPAEIIITGFADEEYRIQAEKMGIQDYLFKPFDTNEFIQVVKKHLGEGRQ